MPDIQESSTKTPKYFFMYLMAFFTLYVSVGSFIGLIYQYINLLFPRNFSLFSPISAMRWHLAVLFIAFPIYLFLTSRLTRECLMQSDKRDSRVRRWLIYFTLFMSTLLIMCWAN